MKRVLYRFLLYVAISQTLHFHEIKRYLKHVLLHTVLRLDFKPCINSKWIQWNCWVQMIRVTWVAKVVSCILFKTTFVIETNRIGVYRFRWKVIPRILWWFILTLSNTVSKLSITFLLTRFTIFLFCCLDTLTSLV